MSFRKHPLHAAAESADAAYSRIINVVSGGKRNRWTLTASDRANPSIAKAYKDKIAADEAWLNFLRTGRA